MNQKKQPAIIIGGTSAAVKTTGNPDESNWRNEKQSANERYAHLLETGEGADVFFLVGKPGEAQELIAAHKTILFAGSRVFGIQFTFLQKISSSEGTKEKPVEVRDIHPGAFRAMLRFVYADDFSGITKLNVMDVYDAAKKYMLDSLANRCRQSVLNGQHLNVGNALSVLKHAQQHEDKELIDHCWSFVDANVTAILGTEEFLALNQHDLCELFSRDSLAVTEFDLFHNLHRWAIVKCDAAKLKPTPENLQNIVGDAIYQIRFPLMSQEDFTNEIVPTGLINERDMLAVYVYFNGSKEEAWRRYPNRFNDQQRRHLRPTPTHSRILSVRVPHYTGISPYHNYG